MQEERDAILIVDDEPANLQKLKRTFVNEFVVFEADRAERALEILARETISAIVTDQRMPGMTGVELLRRSLEVSPESVRIILTGYTEVDDLMNAINDGHVHHYITKPWEPTALKQLVRQETERWRLRRENQRLAQQLKAANELLQQENLTLKQEMEWLQDNEIVYESRAMRDLLKLLDRVVVTDSTVLIQGETGTGKELLARYIHEKSARRHKPVVPVNCAAIPPDLVESAFFGHRKGAFTGATEDKKGYFELADGGTLFLDEIGEAPMELQAKLLRVLQEGEIFPVGAQKARRISVRVIASTNRSLSQRVEEGRFRQDLFFRLNVFSVHVPPLRVRREDIELLAKFFLERFGKRMAREVAGLEPATLAVLKEYYWPGNVRELENEIERMLILCEDGRPISPDMVSERIRFGDGKPESRGPLKEKIQDLERRLILEALKAHNYNKSQAAESLGISRQTVIAKLKQYGE